MQKLLIRQVLTKSMVWSWRFSRRQCALNHDAIESAPIVSSVINKPTTLSCVYHLSTDDLLWRNFYRAMLCIHGTSHGPVSVCVCLCLSVTSRCSTKTAKRRITETTPHNTPGTLVFCCQRSPRNSTGVTPYEGAKRRWGGSKSATFDK